MKMNNTDMQKLNCTCYPICQGNRDYCETYFECYKVLVVDYGSVTERVTLGCTDRYFRNHGICNIRRTEKVAISCCSNGTRCNDELTLARLPSPVIHPEPHDVAATSDMAIFIALPFIAFIIVLAVALLCKLRQKRRTSHESNYV